MNLCRVCDEPLVLEFDSEDVEEATSSARGGAITAIPDDLELQCKCHFHWQCFLDESPSIISTLQCPSCSVQILDAVTQQIVAHHINEGGSTTLNILPLIHEEAYLASNPSARPARAFLTMCSEGDVGGVVELLHNLSRDDENVDEEEEEENSMTPMELLQYQDPLDSNRSALHVAVMKDQIEIIWLLLWLASAMPSNAFPQQAVNAAMSMGASRQIAETGLDVRQLKDANGSTAGQVAAQCGGSVAEMVRAGIL